MGQCYGKFSSTDAEKKPEDADVKHIGSANHFPFDTPAYSFKSYNPSPFPPASPLPDYGASPLPSTPRSRRPFPPPSPAKLIQSVLAKRRIKSKAKEGTISEVDESEKHLDLHFNYSKKFGSKYELLHEIGRGHFGRTCFAKVKKGELKGLSVAVKVIEKAQMTTAIAIEDVQREVKILRALSGHTNVVRFYDACEDKENVYIVMELCSGGELLDRILSRGGKFSEGDAKNVLEQILNIVGFCHLQGVVHRDLKLENFLFATTDGDASLKAIDFGLSEFVNLDQKLNDIVGSAYYVAPEVLKRSYSMEADMWSVGVIAYIILCGCRPFWARTESGIFRSVQRANPSFDDDTWTTVSGEAKDFVKLLLIKDPHRRMTAAQALTHPWIRGDFVIPLDLFIYKHTRAYLRSSALKQAALKAVSKTLTEDESYYLREQYALLQPNQHKKVSLENFKKALIRNSTEAMKESRSFEVVYWMDALAKRMMDFEEFCAAAISIRQLEGRDGWEDRAIIAFKYFEKHENRVGTLDTLAQDLGFTPAFPAKLNLHELIRHDDENISFIGFSNLLHGVTPLSRKEID